MPENKYKKSREAKKSEKNELKKRSGLYGEKNLTGSEKKKHQTAWTKTVDGKKKVVGTKYFKNKKAAEAAGYSAEYQARPTQSNKKGKIKLGGAVGSKSDKSITRKEKLKEVDEDFSKYESTKNNEPNLVGKSKTKTATNQKEFDEKLDEAAKEAKIGKYKSVSDVGKKEFKENERIKAENEKGKYVSGSQTDKQTDANRTARRKAKNLGGEGKRSTYSKLKKQNKRKKSALAKF